MSQLLKPFLSCFLVLVLTISPLQTLIAQTSQSVAAQNDMSSMIMNAEPMATDCEHCEKMGNMFINCSFPSSNTFAVNHLSTLLLKQQALSRLSLHTHSSNYKSHLPGLPKKPPIS